MGLNTSVRCVAVLTFISVVCATSWLRKEDERDFKITMLKEGKADEWKEKEVVCHDELSAKKCNKLNNLCDLPVVREKCAGTCGVCRAAGPPVCNLTKFKCCWDNTTIAQGKNNEGCPSCSDRYAECRLLKSTCDRHDIKIMCPITCGVQCKQCEDNKYQKPVCPMYKEYGFCQASPELMEKMCAKTCGFCSS